MSSSRISLTEAQALPDILSGENFRLNIGEIPNGAGDASDLAVKCQTAFIPGRTNEAFDVSLGAFIRTFSGRNRWQNTFGVSFVEDIQLGTSLKLRKWLEAIRGTESGTAIGNIDDYAVDAELSIFDQAGREVEVINFKRFYIMSISDMQLEVQSSQPVQIQAEFKYDYVTYSDITMR